MDLSDYQILNVIKTYVKSMIGRVPPSAAKNRDQANPPLPSSDEGMRKILFDRIEEAVYEKVKKREA